MSLLRRVCWGVRAKAAHAAAFAFRATGPRWPSPAERFRSGMTARPRLEVRMLVRAEAPTDRPRHPCQLPERLGDAEMDRQRGERSDRSVDLGGWRLGHLQVRARLHACGTDRHGGGSPRMGHYPRQSGEPAAGCDPVHTHPPHLSQGCPVIPILCGLFPQAPGVPKRTPTVRPPQPAVNPSPAVTPAGNYFQARKAVVHRMPAMATSLCAERAAA